LSFKIYKVSANFIKEVTILHSKFEEREIDFNNKNVAEALNTSIGNARNAINAAQQLSLLNISEKFKISLEEKQKLLFRQHLQSFIPFFDFLEMLYEGKTPEEATRIINVLHKWGRSEKDIIWIFKNWGEFAGIFQNTKGSLKFVKNLKKPGEKHFIKIIQDLDDGLKAKIWIKQIIGNTNGFVSNSDYINLTKSILMIQTEPRESLKNAGAVLEDFLRKIAKINNVDVSKKNGISQIASELRKNKLLAGKHIGILEGLQVFLDRRVFDNFSAFRNMATHGIDKEENKKWEFSTELALSFIIQVILCIKSIYFYFIEKKLVF